MLVAWVLFPAVLAVLAAAGACSCAAWCGRSCTGRCCAAGRRLDHRRRWAAHERAGAGAGDCAGRGGRGERPVSCACPRGRGGWRPDPWAVALAGALLLVYGAPVILSGHATFAGYLKLDDTATWLSIVDRLLAHGRSLSVCRPRPTR